MEKADVLVKLTPIFRSVFNEASLVVTETLTAKDVDQWDSLSHMLLITEVEKEFSFKFKLKDLNKMQNVGDMVDIIISRI